MLFKGTKLTTQRTFIWKTSETFIFCCQWLNKALLAFSCVLGSEFRSLGSYLLVGHCLISHESLFPWKFNRSISTCVQRLPSPCNVNETITHSLDLKELTLMAIFMHIALLHVSNEVDFRLGHS